MLLRHCNSNLQSCNKCSTIILINYIQGDKKSVNQKTETKAAYSCISVSCIVYMFVKKNTFSCIYLILDLVRHVAILLLYYSNYRHVHCWSWTKLPLQVNYVLGISQENKLKQLLWWIYLLTGQREANLCQILCQMI